jgi:hypothetical protein
VSPRVPLYHQITVQPVSEAARTLASEEGLRRFQMILAALDVWTDRLTPVQKRIIREGGGVAAKVTAEKLAGLGLAAPRDGALALTEWGEFVRRVNVKQAPQGLRDGG